MSTIDRPNYLPVDFPPIECGPDLAGFCFLMPVVNAVRCGIDLDVIHNDAVPGRG